MIRFRRRYLLVLALGCSAWAVGALAQDQAPLGAIDLDTPLSLDKLAAQLATKRVVFVGETHDQYEDHLNQLEIIRRLDQMESNLAIGVEYFEQPFQSQVDGYIASQPRNRTSCAPPAIFRTGATIIACTRRFFDSPASSGFRCARSTCRRLCLPRSRRLEWPAFRTTARLPAQGNPPSRPGLPEPAA